MGSRSAAASRSRAGCTAWPLHANSVYGDEDDLPAFGGIREAPARPPLPGESFSEVVLRASWPVETITGAEVLARYREHGPFFTEEQLARVEELKRDDRPPEDKWAGR